MMADKRTSIQIYQSTKDALNKLGKKSDTYDTIIQRLLKKPLSFFRFRQGK